MPIKRPATISVSEKALRSAAKRLLQNGQIIWNEIFYLQRTMKSRATQLEIDDAVLAVRRLSWKELNAE